MVTGTQGGTPDLILLIDPCMRMYELKLACAIPTHSLPGAAAPHGDSNHLQMLRNAKVVVIDSGAR